MEMGALGDEVVGILKGYSNRLVLQIEVREGREERREGGLGHYLWRRFVGERMTGPMSWTRW